MYSKNVEAVEKDMVLLVFGCTLFPSRWRYREMEKRKRREENEWIKKWKKWLGWLKALTVVCGEDKENHPNVWNKNAFFHGPPTQTKIKHTLSTLISLFLINSNHHHHLHHYHAAFHEEEEEQQQVLRCHRNSFSTVLRWCFLSPTWAKDKVLMRTRVLVSGGEFTNGRLGVHGKARHFFNFCFSLIFFSVATNSSSLFFFFHFCGSSNP